MTRPTAVPLDRLFDAIYAVERSPAEWLRGVLDTVRPALDQGLGMCGYFWDCSDPTRFQAWGFQGPPGFDEAFARWVEAQPSELLVRSHLSIRYARQSAAYPVHSGDEIAVTSSSTGFADSLGLNAYDASHRGVSISAQSMRLIPPLSAATNQLLDILTRHLARAARVVVDHEKPRPIEARRALELEPSIGREALREVAFRAAHEQPRVTGDRAAQAWDELESGRVVLLDQ